MVAKGLTEVKLVRNTDVLILNNLHQNLMMNRVLWIMVNSASHNTIGLIQVDKALQLLQTFERIAFIDVRDRKSYVDEHPIFAVNAPIDSIELQINQLFGDELGIALIIGDNPTMTDWAAAVIADATRLTPQIIDGGFDAWKNHRLPVWGGEYTPSKAFGEWVETTGNIQNIKPEDAINSPPHYQFDVRPFDRVPEVQLTKLNPLPYWPAWGSLNFRQLNLPSLRGPDARNHRGTDPSRPGF